MSSNNMDFWPCGHHRSESTGSIISQHIPSKPFTMNISRGAYCDTPFTFTCTTAPLIMFAGCLSKTAVTIHLVSVYDITTHMHPCPNLCDVSPVHDVMFHL
ncbi:hypothetical protein LSH36_471g02001 [Paralvinella palmiformis]|uniref:Uncharacterized protein n=1 Tax=Paralvinella palmiformis TaxID=53620 RepID=A0AAD9MZS0_9ANNE|nr:hypothetical protein LSH36_471g02001 [Paralvinella palmiformis]